VDRADQGDTGDLSDRADLGHLADRAVGEPNEDLEPLRLHVEIGVFVGGVADDDDR
jgi:hypothetical protein